MTITADDASGPVQIAESSNGHNQRAWWLMPPGHGIGGATGFSGPPVSIGGRGKALRVILSTTSACGRNFPGPVLPIRQQEISIFAFDCGALITHGGSIDTEAAQVGFLRSAKTSGRGKLITLALGCDGFRVTPWSGPDMRTTGNSRS